jgi:hypothetical protein
VFFLTISLLADESASLLMNHFLGYYLGISRDGLE